MSGDSYRIDLREMDGAAILTLRNKQYFSDSQSVFIERLKEAEALTDTGLVVLDLAEAQQITSGPLGALRASHRRLAASGGRIVAAGGGDFAIRVLSFAANFIDHHPSIEAAMTANTPDPA